EYVRLLFRIRIFLRIDGDIECAPAHHDAIHRAIELVEAVVVIAEEPVEAIVDGGDEAVEAARHAIGDLAHVRRLTECAWQRKQCYPRVSWGRLFKALVFSGGGCSSRSSRRASSPPSSSRTIPHISHWGFSIPARPRCTRSPMAALWRHVLLLSSN